MMKCPIVEKALPVEKIQSVPCRLVGHYTSTWDTMLCLLGTAGLQDYSHIARELDVNSSRGKLSVVCLKIFVGHVASISQIYFRCSLPRWALLFVMLLVDNVQC